MRYNNQEMAKLVLFPTVSICPMIYSFPISPPELLDAASGPSLALLDSQAKTSLSKRGPPATLRHQHPSTAAHGVHLFLQGAAGEFYPPLQAHFITVCVSQQVTVCVYITGCVASNNSIRYVAPILVLYNRHPLVLPLPHSQINLYP